MMETTSAECPLFGQDYSHSFKAGDLVRIDVSSHPTFNILDIAGGEVCPGWPPDIVHGLTALVVGVCTFYDIMENKIKKSGNVLILTPSGPLPCNVRWCRKLTSTRGCT